MLLSDNFASALHQCDKDVKRSASELDGTASVEEQLAGPMERERPEDQRWID
jgi:hypothetical protein